MEREREGMDDDTHKKLETHTGVLTVNRQKLSLSFIRCMGART